MVIDLSFLFSYVFLQNTISYYIIFCRNINVTNYLLCSLSRFSASKFISSLTP